MTVCWIPCATGWNWKLQCCSWFLKLWVSVFTPEDEAKTAPVWKCKRPSILWNNVQWPFTIHMCCFGWCVARICITIATGLSTWRYVFTEVRVFWCVVWGTVLILVTVLPAVNYRQLSPWVEKQQLASTSTELCADREPNSKTSFSQLKGYIYIYIYINVKKECVILWAFLVLVIAARLPFYLALHSFILDSMTLKQHPL